MCTEEEVGGWWPWNQDNGVSRAFPPKARFVVKHLYSTILLPFLIVVLSNTFQVAWKLVAIASFWMKLLWDIAWSREPWFGLVWFFFHTRSMLADRPGRTLFQEATWSSKLTRSSKAGSQTSPFSPWILSEWRFLRLLTILLEGDTHSLFSSTLNIIFQAFWEALLHFYEETPTANLEIFFETSNTRCSVREGEEAAP